MSRVGEGLRGQGIARERWTRSLCSRTDVACAPLICHHDQLAWRQIRPHERVGFERPESLMRYTPSPPMVAWRECMGVRVDTYGDGH